MSTYRELTQVLAHWRRPVRTELVTMLAEPQRRIVRSLKERAAQLQVEENELLELTDFYSIAYGGRF
jgi:hypothetical protein